MMMTICGDVTYEIRKDVLYSQRPCKTNEQAWMRVGEELDVESRYMNEGPSAWTGVK